GREKVPDPAVAVRGRPPQRDLLPAAQQERQRRHRLEPEVVAAGTGGEERPHLREGLLPAPAPATQRHTGGLELAGVLATEAASARCAASTTRRVSTRPVSVLATVASIRPTASVVTAACVAPRRSPHGDRVDTAVRPRRSRSSPRSVPDVPAHAGRGAGVAVA